MKQKLGVAAWLASLLMCVLVVTEARYTVLYGQRSSERVAPAWRVKSDNDGRLAITFGERRNEERVEVWLNPLTRKVTDVIPVERTRRAVVIGTSGVAETIEVIDLVAAQSIGSLNARAPAVSLNGRFVAFERFRPRTEPHRAEYVVLRAAEMTNENEVSGQTVVFPTDGATEHYRQSALFWLEGNVLAFLDYCDGVARVVAVSVRGQPSRWRLGTKELDTRTLVNAADVDANKPPATALYDPKISRLVGEEGLVLRLRFPNETALLVRRVDVVMWSHEQ